MSIVTLKRKSQVKYNNMSVNKPNFSLNGTLRNQGYVGQTSLSRTLLKTPMKGNVPCGHGGCCGKFDKSQLILAVNPISVTMNDNDIIKSSVLNTSGMIETKYNLCMENLTSKCKCVKHNNVKPDDNHINRQSDYIDNLTKKTLICNLTDTNMISATPSLCSTTVNGTANTKLFTSSSSIYNKGKKNNLYTKPANTFIPISQGNYLLQKQQKCLVNDVDFFKRKRSMQGVPFDGFRANC
jgi:hypothetical protein